MNATAISCRSTRKHINKRDKPLQLLTLYEEHLRQSAAVVTEEQNNLTRNIKQTDATVAQILG